MMSDILLGIFALLAGLVFCFRGYLAMRVVIPIWGAFTGFVLGAGLVANLGNEGFLVSALGWIVGAVLAVIFALLAYLYYEVAVLIGMAAIGFALGTTLMVAIGVTWSWLIVLVGLVVGVLLAVLTIVGDLPGTLLMVLTAFGGASAVVAGLMLLFGVISVDELDSESTTQTIPDDWWWYAIYLGLAIAGMIAQYQSTARLRGSLRDSWTESGGRHLKSV